MKIIILLLILFLSCKSPSQINLPLEFVDTLRITCYYGDRITSTGIKPYDGICAISPDLLSKIKMGDWLVIDNRIYVVMDKTSRKLKKTVDLYQTKRFCYKRPVWKIKRK